MCEHLHIIIIRNKKVRLQTQPNLLVSPSLHWMFQWGLMAKTEIVDVFWKLWLYWGSRICKSSFSLGALLIPSVFFLCTHFLSLSNFSKYPQIPTSSVWMPFCSVSLDRCCFHIWPALSLSHAIRISTFSCFNFFPEKQFAPLHYRPEWGNMKHPFCTSLCHDHLDQIQKMNEIVCFN